MKIIQSIVVMLGFHDFQNGGRTPSWILEIQIF